jgi:regulator of ribonuclease activity A
VNPLPPIADLCDAHPDSVKMLDAEFQLFTDVTRFHGPARLINLHAADGFLAETLATPGDGAVAVVHVGADPAPAVFGDGMARNAEANGWAGLVILGALRDVDLIAPRKIGIAAMGVAPFIRRDGPGGLEADVLYTADTRLVRGDFIAVDADGIVALPAEIAAQLS